VRTLIRSNLDVWKGFVGHDFVKQLGQGTLSRERFVHFLKCAARCRSLSRDGLLIRIHPCRQDYLYLKYYGRANGYGCHKLLKLSCAEVSDLFLLQSSGG
jgi:hydroxymethylpyrimidine/phosphomethylpyrimidine kinase